MKRMNKTKFAKAASAAFTGHRFYNFSQKKLIEERLTKAILEAYKQRKATLEEYQQTFLQVPRIDDRKPVFVSSDVRDRLDRVVRILGGRRMSVSGIIENIVRHHLSLYEEDFEAWRKL